MYDFLHTTYNIQHTTYKKRGFTLIELLIVVAIIGILSVAAFATFGNTRGRARDAVRVSDISQIQTILTIENLTPLGSRLLTGCTGAGGERLTTLCTGSFLEIASFEDPLYSSSGVCTSSSAGGCDYTIYKSGGGVGAKTDDYQICFWIEDPTSLKLPGPPPAVAKVLVTPSTPKLGTFSLGC